MRKRKPGQRLPDSFLNSYKSHQGISRPTETEIKNVDEREDIFVSEIDGFDYGKDKNPD